jgi:hypothetical protein
MFFSYSFSSLISILHRDCQWAAEPGCHIWNTGFTTLTEVVVGDGPGGPECIGSKLGSKRRKTRVIPYKYKEIPNNTMKTYERANEKVYRNNNQSQK